MNLIFLYIRLLLEGGNICMLGCVLEVVKDMCFCLFISCESEIIYISLYFMEF